MKLHVIASGSKGNCSVIENTISGHCLAIDCGISFKAFRSGCEASGIDPTRIEAVLVTHEHTDHTKGLGVLTRGLARLGASPAIFASQAVHETSADLRAIQNAVDLRHFTAQDSLSLGGMAVSAFRTSHDAAESFGFRFDNEGESIGFMTDTGIVTGEAAELLQHCNILAIEANHDPKMLANGPYPAYLKARVGGDFGHLSNEQSASLLESLLHNDLEFVIGMHISQNNNDYRLPKQALANVLERSGHCAQALVGFQQRPVSVG